MYVPVLINVAPLGAVYMSHALTLIDEAEDIFTVTAMVMTLSHP
jgi:hypothetical protein